MKKYKAIFFDWDGTAVLSRKAPTGQVAEQMKRLLGQGVCLAVISGTTIETVSYTHLGLSLSMALSKVLTMGYSTPYPHSATRASI